MDLSAIGAFAAVAILLNRLIAIPAPFLPFLYYEVWEIPIVVAFLAFGARVAVPAAIVNFFVLLLFPGVILAGPLYNLIAILSMLSGIAISGRFFSKNNGSEGKKFNVALSTLLGMVLRVSVMTVVNAALLQLPPPLGFSATISLIKYWLPLIAFFNATVCLYTIPVAYAVARASGRLLRR